MLPWLCDSVLFANGRYTDLKRVLEFTMVDFKHWQKRSLVYAAMVFSFFIGGLASMSLDADWLAKDENSTQDIITIGDYDGEEVDDAAPRPAAPRRGA